MSNGPEVPQTAYSVAVKCADDLSIIRCLDSIDDPRAAVNAVITPSPRIESLLEQRNVPYSITSYGNIAMSAQLSVEQAEHDRVIVMDSDAWFAPGALTKLNKALDDAIVAKPRLDFSNNGTRISRIIAESRRQYNAIPNHATNPGLALHRSKVEDACGYVFNPAIRWTEDADLDYRLKRAGVEVKDTPDAVIHHEAVSLKHELRCAFLYGVGKRLSIEHTEGRPSSEDAMLIFQRLMRKSPAHLLMESLATKGVGGTALAAGWRTLYLAGYHAQKYTNKWTLQN